MTYVFYITNPLEYPKRKMIRLNDDNPTIGEILSKMPDNVSIYGDKFDALRNINPIPQYVRINDLGIRYRDHKDKLWFFFDNDETKEKKQIFKTNRAFKKLNLSKLPLADDLTEMISKKYSHMYDTNKKGGKRSSKYSKKYNKTKKKYKNKQKGGLFVKIDENHLLNWETPHSLKYDCTPCALNFIGYDREYCDVMCGLYGTTGTRIKDTLDILKHKYPNFNFDFKKLKSMKSIVDKFDDDTITDTDLENYKNILLELFDNIPNDYSMMGQINFKDAKFGHSVVFGKLNDKPLFYDTQNDIFINDLDDIILHLITRRVTNVGVYYGRSKTTTHMLVDDYSLGL